MIWSSILAILSGHLVGLSLGATGAGGAMLAVPLLVYVLGTPVQEAVGVSLVIVGFSSILGAVRSARVGNVRPTIALVLSVTGGPGAWIGARAHGLVEDQVALLLFGVLMVGVSIRMMWRGAEHAPVARIGPAASHGPPWAWAGQIAGLGLLIGLLTGFFGVGGGFIVVPTLIYVLGLPMHVAVGTSLLTTALLCVGGLAGHLQQGVLDLHLIALMLLGSAVGLILGMKLGSQMPASRLARVFASLTLIVATSLIADNGVQLIAR